MTLADFSKSLVEKDLFQTALGISKKEFDSIKKKFNLSNAKDRTKSTPKEYRLLILLLIKQYHLSSKNIKKIFLPGTTPTVFKAFVDKVMPRLEAALSKLPEIVKKLDKHKPLILPSTLTKYTDLETFLHTILFAAQQDNKNSVLTAKVRELTPNWLKAYAIKPVSQKTKTGQKGFAQMATSLLYDIESFTKLSPPQIILFASTLNLHIHHASFAPGIGYGKVQTREMEHPLYYSRSQSKHVHGAFFKCLNGNQKDQCLLPSNLALSKIFSYEVKGNFVKVLQRYDMKGYLKAEQTKAPYFSLDFAYSGLRMNAYKFTILGIETYLKNHDTSDLVKLIDLKPDSHLLKISPSILRNKILNMHENLNELNKSISHSAYFPNLYLALTHFRRKNIQTICQSPKIQRLNNIQVSHDTATNCLDIQFYPNQLTKDHNSANYSEGITNVIISFFTGLLNYHLYMAGLNIKVHRRQSFAFNRMTITDTTNLCMRVSMGYEPETFIPVFIKTLTTLNTLLTNFNFLNKKDEKLAAGFKVVEKARGEEATDKTGINFLKFMRSTANTLIAVENAEKSLLACRLDNDFYKNAFQMYINSITSSATIDDPCMVPKNIPEDIKSTPDNILIKGFLHNILKYALNKIEESKYLLDQQDSIYLYSHIITKLTKSCQKAAFWLENHTDYLSSHVYSKVVLLAEDMMEILSVLDSLCVAHNLDKIDPIEQLRKTDRQYTISALGLKSGQAIDVFYTDNGQQALTASILCMTMQIFKPEDFRSLSTLIYPFGKCYFELFKNLEGNLDLTISNDFNKSRFILVDIRELAAFQEKYSSKSSAEVVVIDCTHNPCLEDGELKDVTTQLLKDKKYVVIVESMLKHEQLGLDKIQAGKLIVLSPIGKLPAKNIRDELLSITNAAMHPVIASYFNMINDICRDKIELPASINTVSLFKAPISTATHQETLPSLKK